MKTKLLFIASLITVMTYAQSPINTFYVNDAASFAVVTSNTPIDQTASGANQVWNFDQLVNTGTSTYAKANPTAAQLTSFPNTNNVVVSSVDAVQTSEMFVKDVANVISITGIRAAGLELNFITNNATLGAFPMTYGFSNTDTVAGTYVYTTYSGTFTGNIVTSVDAYGTLYRNVGGVPNSNATRLKTVITINLNYGFFSNVGTITQTTYSYYQDPLISADGLLFRTSTTKALVPLASIDQTDTVMESYIATGLSTETFLSSQLAITQNPVQNQLQLELTDAITIQAIQIIDTNGRTVISKSSDEKSMDVSLLQKGVYFAKIETNKGTVIKKIIKE
ncbi:T9SS type A sorting domain-containing protein [Flavobacterium sp.]|uniref:T9SS type A sorting domain-containing protein n=1 Tax=Flavobacterium sp. TaxID=239 RepID=UPI00263257AB|nr:T9SS type A sorting domain-containing protein [Flavobacterium sp.]